MEESKEDILKSLEPLFLEAVSKELWFYCNYQSIWFTPSELREQHRKDKFIWGPANWKLRKPMEYYTEVENQIKAKEQHLSDIRDRMKSEKYRWEATKENLEE